MYSGYGHTGMGKWEWVGLHGFGRVWLCSWLAALGHTNISIPGGEKAQVTLPGIEPAALPKTAHETVARQ